MKTKVCAAVVFFLLFVIGCGRANTSEERETPLPTESSVTDTSEVEIIPSEAPQEDKQTMYGRLSKSVVLINIYDDYNEIIGTASGFYINDNTTLVTCDHVIEGAYYLEALCEDGSSTLCKEVIAHNAERDLAILKCETPLEVSPLTLGDSSSIAKGDSIFVIGSPLGLQNTVSEGIVSGIRMDGDTDIVQITAPISSGSSGGAVFNENGEVIGIASASFTKGQNLNLAIASNEVSELMSERLQDSNYVLLSDLYADFTAYGVSSMNLVRGKVTENREYVFFVETETTLVSEIVLGREITRPQVISSRIKQYSKLNKEIRVLDTGLFEASNLNIYHNKLYFSKKLSEDEYGVFLCETGDNFGDNSELLLTIGPQQSVYRMLLAENMIILGTYGYDSETFDFHMIMQVFDLNTLEIISTFDYREADEFFYFDNTLYTIDIDRNELLGMDLKTGTINKYFPPAVITRMRPSKDGFILWNAVTDLDDITQVVLYKFNASTGFFSQLYSDYCYGISDVCVCGDNTVLIIEDLGYESQTDSDYNLATYSIQSGTKTLYPTQFTDRYFFGVYLLDYRMDIPELGWKGDAILGLWESDGNGSSLRG